MVLPSVKLHEATSPDDIVRRIHENGQHHGGILSIRFFCGSSEADAILLMVDAGEHSQRCAETFGGLLFGGVAACRVFPVRADFDCAGRSGGRLTGSSCDRCNARNWGPASAAGPLQPG